MDCGASLEDVYVELQDASDHTVLARGHTDANGKVTLEYFKEWNYENALDLGMRDTTGKFFVTAMLRGYNMFAIPSGQMADDPRRTHPESDGPEGCGHYREEPCDGPAVAPFEPKDSYCPVGQTCDVACAKGFAGFDAAKNCKNANVGYCCN